MDQDLKAYLDQSFASLNLAFQQQFQQLRGEFQELREDFQQLRDEVAQLSLRLDRVEARLDRVEARLDTLEGEVRKTYILIEDLRGQIRLVAEGVANVNQRMGRHQDKIGKEVYEIRTYARLAYHDLNERVRRLEAAAG